MRSDLSGHLSWLRRDRSAVRLAGPVDSSQEFARFAATPQNGRVWGVRFVGRASHDRTATMA